MKFQFDITLNDNDYLEYNKFHLLKSTYEKNILVIDEYNAFLDFIKTKCSTVEYFN